VQICHDASPQIVATGVLTVFEATEDCAEDGCTSYGLGIRTMDRDIYFGMCIPGGWDAPPIGSVISIDATLALTEWCYDVNEALTIRDESGNLLLHAVRNMPVDLGETGTVERVPTCHVDGPESVLHRDALRVTIGGDQATLGSGDTTSIGGYDVAVYQAGSRELCEGDSECSLQLDRVVVRRR
jgi:hypothetical protein